MTLLEQCRAHRPDLEWKDEGFGRGATCDALSLRVWSHDGKFKSFMELPTLGTFCAPTPELAIDMIEAALRSAAAKARLMVFAEPDPAPLGRHVTEWTSPVGTIRVTIEVVPNEPRCHCPWEAGDSCCPLHGEVSE